MLLSAQSSWELLQYQQTELRGTARYMSMAGAFTALGGDLSTTTNNPGGIGVYRSSDIGVTINLDFMKGSTPGNSVSSTKFHCNNFGYIGAFKSENGALRNINIGATYNRQNFNRRYVGGQNGLTYSLSNFIAGEPNGSLWMTTLADKTKINYLDDMGNVWGLYGITQNPETGKTIETSGYSEFEVMEQGGVNQGDFTFGGNVSDKFYWGVGFGIASLNMDTYVYNGESLKDAFVDADNTLDNVNYGFEHTRNTKGTGWNFKAGVIFAPISSIRIGAAIHTPTYYKMTDVYETGANSYFESEKKEHRNCSATTTVYYRLRTPLRVMAGVAGVIGTYGIVSLDYEFQKTDNMKIADDRNNQSTWSDINSDIQTYFQPTHIIKAGAEFRATPKLSVRAGYSYQTSAVKKDVRDNVIPGTDGAIYTDMDHTSSYTVDNNTQNLCLGLGYRHKNIYADLAYVHRIRKSSYHPYTCRVWMDETNYYVEANPTSVDSRDNNIVLTLGFRF